MISARPCDPLLSRVEIPPSRYTRVTYSGETLWWGLMTSARPLRSTAAAGEIPTSRYT